MLDKLRSFRLIGAVIFGILLLSAFQNCGQQGGFIGDQGSSSLSSNSGEIPGGGGSIAFDHSKITITSCNSCHEGVRPKPVNAQNHGGNEDCIHCHTPNSGWTYSLNFFTHSKVSVNSCVRCHANDRPATGQRMRNDVQLNNTSHYGAIDCASCHLPDSNAFQHKNYANQNIQFCLPCHADAGRREHGNQPTWFQPPIYDFNAGQLGNCYSCHNRGKSWGR